MHSDLPEGPASARRQAARSPTSSTPRGLLTPHGSASSWAMAADQVRERTRATRRDLRAAGAPARHRPRGDAGRCPSCDAGGTVLVLYGDVPLIAAGDAALARRGRRRAAPGAPHAGGRRPQGLRPHRARRRRAGRAHRRGEGCERRTSARSARSTPASWPLPRERLERMAQRRLGNANAQGEYYLTDVDRGRGRRRRARSRCAHPAARARMPRRQQQGRARHPGAPLPDEPCREAPRAGRHPRRSRRASTCAASSRAGATSRST